MRKTLMILAILLCLDGQADDRQPLKVIFGQSRPPYVMAEQRSGVSVELAREAFKRMGVAFEPLFASNRRMEVELKQGRVDVAVEVQPSEPELFYSQPFMVYRNYLVARRQQGIVFSGQWSTLQGRSVCAWQNAEQNLGADFAEASKGFASYAEYSSQQTQIEQWLLRQCEVILVDGALLKWHWQRLREQNPRVYDAADSDVAYTPLPQGHELWWHVGFRSRELRDRFDKTLSKMHADGSYRRIQRGFGLE